MKKAFLYLMLVAFTFGIAVPSVEEASAAIVTKPTRPLVAAAKAKKKKKHKAKKKKHRKRGGKRKL